MSGLTMTEISRFFDNLTARIPEDQYTVSYPLGLGRTSQVRLSFSEQAGEPGKIGKAVYDALDNGIFPGQAGQHMKHTNREVLVR